MTFDEAHMYLFEMFEELKESFSEEMQEVLVDTLAHPQELTLEDLNALAEVMNISLEKVKPTLYIVK
jgi:hypothetical protein